MKRITAIIVLTAMTAAAFISFLSACAPGGAENVSSPESFAGTDTSAAASAAEAQYVKISAEEAKALMDSGGAIILDVRTQEEYDTGHISGAVRLEAADFAGKAAEVLPDKDSLILVYCRSGNRSRTASNLLLEMGYTDVRDFGGINDWPYETTR